MGLFTEDELRAAAALRRGLLVGGAVILSLPALPGDAAEYRRGCNAEYVISSTLIGSRPARLGFTAFATMDVPYVRIDDVRRRALEAIRTCVYSGPGGTTTAPAECQSSGNIEFLGYPFNDMYADVGPAFCAANPAVAAARVNVHVEVTGREGCWEFPEGAGAVANPKTVYSIAGNINVVCTDTVAPPPAPGTSGSQGPPPAEGGFGEGQMFDRSGSGDDGEDNGNDNRNNTPPPPVPDGSGADFAVLPNIRLPGHDLRQIGVGDGDWRACMAACAADAACNAWTYRDRYQGISSVCLLKRAAGPQIPDPCCRSGVKH